MKYRILGRTGLRVSLMGLGTGGPSLFGQGTGVPESEAGRLVHRALELGVNFFDTSALYGESEAILGRALKGVPRVNYILATKFQAVRGDWTAKPEEVTTSVERSLRRLQVDTIDILQFHGVRPNDYRKTIDLFAPVLFRMREQGKCRFLGVSETYSQDPRHEMLTMALQEGLFDTVMVAYNLLNPTAEQAVLPVCLKENVGVIGMVAVRRALSRPDLLRERIAYAKERGLIDPQELPDDDPLGWLIKGQVTSLPAAGYKYAAGHPAVGTVLTGTASLSHLKENLGAILGPPLPEADLARLRSIFGNLFESLID